MESILEEIKIVARGKGLRGLVHHERKHRKDSKTETVLEEIKIVARGKGLRNIASRKGLSVEVN